MGVRVYQRGPEGLHDFTVTDDCVFNAGSYCRAYIM